MPGRTAGMVMMTIFGAIWWMAGSGTMDMPCRTAALIAGAAVTVALLVYARRQNASATKEPPPGVDGATVMRQFNLVGMAEGLAILVVVIACVATGYPQLIAALVCLVVGVHFLPLAGVFHVPLYRITGGVLVVVAVVTLVAGAAGSWSDDAWLAVPAIAAAIVLWLTAAVLPTSGAE